MFAIIELRLNSADRLLWVWLSRLWSGWRSALVIVKPETVIAWHRKGFRLYWRWKSRHRQGRPSISREVIDLIRKMSMANPRWGAPRVHGELLKLGFGLSESTVAKYLLRPRKPTSQTWRTFLTNHTKILVSSDFFVVPTAFFRALFVFVILSHDRRRPVYGDRKPLTVPGKELIGPFGLNRLFGNRPDLSTRGLSPIEINVKVFTRSLPCPWRRIPVRRSAWDLFPGVMR
jgi:hypothetical protein